MSVTTGSVKWFNTRAGYGFITTSEKEDIFVHQTNVCPKINTYRYLVNGEYVQFEMSEADGVKQAVNVTGINDGPLMCDSHLSKDDEGNVTRVGPTPGRTGGRGGGRGRGGGGRGRGGRGRGTHESETTD